MNRYAGVVSGNVLTRQSAKAQLLKYGFNKLMVWPSTESALGKIDPRTELILTDLKFERVVEGVKLISYAGIELVQAIRRKEDVENWYRAKIIVMVDEEDYSRHYEVVKSAGADAVYKKLPHGQVDQAIKDILREVGILVK